MRRHLNVHEEFEKLIQITSVHLVKACQWRAMTAKQACISLKYNSKNAADLGQIEQKMSEI